MRKTCFLVVMPLVLAGCAPQIVPQTLQTEDRGPLLALETLNESDIGTMYMRCSDNTGGKKVDTGWMSTPYHILNPDIDGKNMTISTGSGQEKDTRKATYITDITAKGGFIPFISSEGNASKAWRYFAKIDSVLTFNSNTLAYNTDTRKMMEDTVTGRNCEFRYIKALHRGTVTIESMDKITINASAQVQAAFSINGQFYKTSEELTSKSGIVLYELSDPIPLPENPSAGIKIEDITAPPLTPRQMQRARMIMSSHP